MFPLTIDAALYELKKMPLDVQIKFDYNYDLSPQNVGSYRGYYDHLAIEPGVGKCTVLDLICMLERSVGSVFHGYKGGEYTMKGSTPLWCANYGETGRGVVGVRLENNLVIIETEEYD